MVDIIFYKSSAGNYIDKLVSLWTLGPYSHCELYFKDIDLCYSCSPRENKVRFKKIDLSSNHWNILYNIDQILNIEINKELCKQLLGKKYDWFGLIMTQIFNLNIQDKNKWFCSEICAYLLGLKNPSIFNPNSLFDYLIKKY